MASMAPNTAASGRVEPARHLRAGELGTRSTHTKIGFRTAQKVIRRGEREV